MIYIPVDRNDSERVADAIRAGVQLGREAGAKNKPVLACIMAAEGARSMLTGSETIPTYLFPEAAAKVLARMYAYREWRDKPLAMVPGFLDIQRDAAKNIVEQALGQRGSGWLSSEESRTLLDAFGIPQVAGGLALTADQAGEIAGRLGFPVVAKLASPKVLHKSDIGAVRVNLESDESVRRAFEEIRQDGMEGVVIQKMITGGVEVMIGVMEDPLFGPLIAFGLGGIHVEILADVCFRVTPLTDLDAREMVREIRGYRLLEGYRGHPPADVAAIEEILLRVSRMVEEISEIRELDLNPVFALTPGEGCLAVDSRIRVAR